MHAPNPSSLRVLLRPSCSITPTQSSSSSSSSSSFSSSSSSSSSSSEGVVVLGFVGCKSDNLTQLINRILDANVFGSGNLDTDLKEPDSRYDEDWFRSRKISYYHDEEKGIVFLQFSSSPLDFDCAAADSCLDSVLEERESGDLKGMLLLFSVCHVIIFCHEGSHFDTQILKKFRILQAAKHALGPFIKSHITPIFTSKAATSSSSLHPTVPAGSCNSSPGRGGGITSRHTSAISLMSGLGSYPPLLPGQCTPVVLFALFDDFLDGSTPGPHVEDMADAFSLNQSASLSGIPRPSMPMKGSSSVVVLARPTSRSEGGLRKKLQTSLEAQIRFLIKKSRTLAGNEASHTGSRGGSHTNSLPLFSLDSSRAVTLLDRSTNYKGESLDYVMGLIDEVIDVKAVFDIQLLENHSQSANREDIQSMKEFINRQSDMLRGRGGLSTNTNSGSAAGGGMVAVAAAAAAASAASVKPFSTPPELPSLGNWLYCSQLILNVLLSTKRWVVDESGSCKKLCIQQNATEGQVDGPVLIETEAIEAALSCLDSGKGLNMKYSMLWCQRALPAAKEVYLKELPACYPTVLHMAHLEKALRAFHLMVKGPAVQVFAKKLEDDCTSIWKSGRQLCDAVSLTGKPCMHQRHNVKASDLPLAADFKPHSSGFVFLHACACGRSRRFRDDPFDFDSANVTFNCFPNCENLLPVLRLPIASNAGHILSSAWNLIRMGGSRYYEPSKGLLQSGFCPTEKFLLRWTILLEKCLPIGGDTQKGFALKSTPDPMVGSVADEETKKAGAAQLFSGDIRPGGLKNQRKPSESISSDDPKISFGRGLPPFAMKKPFSEVVAGYAPADSAFPPLQQRKQSIAGSEKAVKQKGGARVRIEDQVLETSDCQEFKNSRDILGQEISHEVGTKHHTNGDPIIQIGSNVVPVSMNGGGKINSNSSLKHVVVYVGFEHECSFGHRFLLSREHLNELGSSYSLAEESHNLSIEVSDKTPAELVKASKDSMHDKVHPHPTGTAAAAINKLRGTGRSNETSDNNQPWSGPFQYSRSEKEQNQSFTGLPTLSKSVKDIEGGLQYVSLDYGGDALSLLNRNLPIYMNCPHCRISKSTQDHQKIKFASTISQLQRIFLVTPSFPVVLASCPIIQFEASCLPPSLPNREQQSQFSLGCRVILPPESFLTFRLPFVYGVQLDDSSLHPLNHLSHQPELTAWITKGTVLQVVSKGSNTDDGYHK